MGTIDPDPHSLHVDILSRREFDSLLSIFAKKHHPCVHEICRQFRDLLAFVWISRTFDATGPRDENFVLVRLIQDVLKHFVNYNLSLEEVLINAMKHILSQGSLDIFYVA